MGSVPTPSKTTVDILIVGAGLSGLTSLHHVRQQIPDCRVLVLDNGADVGGTWFWNRYPGCRFDCESVSYGFSFDKELLQEWHWKEAFSPQPETHRYIRRFAEKNDLYKHIQFNTSVRSARWSDDDNTWTFTDQDGKQYITTFFLSCIGFLSTPSLPAIPGIENFTGKSFYTSRWPKDVQVSRDFAGKRIGVIGTGATGIQTTTALSKEPGIKSLSVFQRTATWTVPLRNYEISAEKMEDLKKDYDNIFKICRSTPSGFLHMADRRRSTEVSDEERIALWEKLYSEPGFGKWQGVFKDTYVDRQANELYSNFIADKIRQRVHDPETAESLVPTTHGFGTRRVPLESGYFEAFNQPNVHLVDLKKTPISEVKPTGIVTSDGKEHELDVLIYATGFDAITGSFSAINWQGKGGRPLIAPSGTPEGERSVWVDNRPYTFLGMTVPSMPNMFMVLGPHQPFGNATRNIEHAVQVIIDLLRHCRDNGHTYVEATEDAADGWTEHVFECSTGSLVNEVDSWMTGVNTNVRGKAVRSVVRYGGSVQEFQRRCREVKDSGYKGLKLA
ncbi:2-oxo-Delta(3)-4,5,5-trimethylcyclopentenylacetyl-CoA monooxygenase [Colletotrichum spinosum]|uniref:2-oxo-Delta(3)-4,5, 5-trimethylcyclopentenylacetyl-CoA monooxygenase n=1 Tax=Colletotrichum spinosum TaxID=1347390 RepID=A0A4R8PZV0_9PEZI|nr:2-oxo-Delta(3)-4,5,5-trimethylcyclopentenylacetyl-CoA monooxygenase [Colletotrichum spinosum]